MNSQHVSLHLRKELAFGSNLLTCSVIQRLQAFPCQYHITEVVTKYFLYPKYNHRVTLANSLGVLDIRLRKVGSNLWGEKEKRSFYIIFTQNIHLSSTLHINYAFVANKQACFYHHAYKKVQSALPYAFTYLSVISFQWE